MSEANGGGGLLRRPLSLAERAPQHALLLAGGHHRRAAAAPAGDHGQRLFEAVELAKVGMRPSRQTRSPGRAVQRPFGAWCARPIVEIRHPRIFTVNFR